ncbi:heme exporter protein CcmD [Litorivita pollutaquae]|nr:heme exporter protein CcmD [Rhodobacterales bacterium 59_46_T64]
MPELGKYASEVLASYAVSIALLAVLVAVSVARARRLRRDLAQVEERMKRNG